MPVDHLHGASCSTQITTGMWHHILQCLCGHKHTVCLDVLKAAVIVGGHAWLLAAVHKS